MAKNMNMLLPLTKEVEVVNEHTNRCLTLPEIKNVNEAITRLSFETPQTNKSLEISTKHMKEQIF